jgi:hypothetical protein
LAEVFEVTDEIKAQYGKETDPWVYEVTTTSVRMYARGIGSTDPIHYDVDFAKKQGFRNIVAPLGYVGTPVFHPDTNDGTFGFPRRGGGARLNLPTKGLLDGGTETEYLDYICAGDTLVETSHLAEVKVRGNMVFVTNESVFKDQASGKVVAKQRLTSIHIG